LIVNWEAKLNSQAELEPPVEDSGDLITDPGYTHDHLTLFKQYIHLYRLMKCIVAKAIAATASTTMHNEAEPSL